MKVLFLEDDRIENVSDGYARNYLFPKKLAVAASKMVLAAAERRKDKKQAEIESKRLQLKELADKLGTQEVTVTADVGEGGKLFGSVTTADIVSAVKKDLGIDLDKKKIELIDPIKMVGEYTVKVKLFQDISAGIKLKVAAK